MIRAEQVRMARAGLRMRTRDLAAAAGIGPNTVTRIEAGLGANASTLAAVRRALEAAGASFPDEDGERCAVSVPVAGAGLDAERLRPEELNASNDG